MEPKERAKNTDLLTAEEAAPLLRLSAYTVRLLLRDGRLAGIKVGGRGSWRIHKRAVEAYHTGKVAQLYHQERQISQSIATALAGARRTLPTGDYLVRIVDAGFSTQSNGNVALAWVLQIHEPRQFNGMHLVKYTPLDFAKLATVMVATRELAQCGLSERDVFSSGDMPGQLRGLDLKIHFRAADRKTEVPEKIDIVGRVVS